ncbi:MAG: hypothetical protein CBC48_00050 [bacterium TMED88]|nr:hypothetical protein [Deltaproteobacteria bacterium]OUV37711.1 MAG: hypothetical protein CBC48_00050 [bacterium TMED88]
MSDLLVYQLEFSEKGDLESAFELLIDEKGVTSCAVEIEARTARFLAPETAGRALVERIYGIGGLRWCSRHPVSPTSGQPKPNPPPKDS